MTNTQMVSNAPQVLPEIYCGQSTGVSLMHLNMFQNYIPSSGGPLGNFTFFNTNIGLLVTNYHNIAEHIKTAFIYQGTIQAVLERKITQ